MGLRGWPFGLVLIAALVVGALPALAQPTNYRDIPIGERSIGMGGAFTGVADDPSAAYYNPAGLVTGDKAQFSGSLSLFAFGRTKIQDGLTTPEGSVNFVSKVRLAIPPFAGAVLQFGKKRYRKHKYALAYSSVQPNRTSEVYNVSIENPATESGVRIAVDNRLSLHGFSFAARLSRKWSFGFTWYLGVQKEGYREDVALAAGGTFDPNGERIDADSLVSSTLVGVRGFYFVPRLGILYRKSSKWSLGAMFQLPSIPLKEKGKLRRQMSTFDAASGESTFSLIDESNLSANAPIPWQLNLGAAMTPKKRSTVGFDVAVYGWVKDRDVIKLPSTVDISEDEIGVFFSNSTERRVAANVSIGGEYDFGKLALLAGLFTNLSSAPKVPASTQSYTMPRIHMFGASAAIGVHARDYRLSTGVTAMWGRGDALAATVNSNADVLSYDRTNAMRRAFLFHISGAVSTVSRAASDVIAGK